MKNSHLGKSIILIAFILLFFFNLRAQNSKGLNERYGVVVYPSDIISVGAMQWCELLESNNLNLLGIHTDTRLETLPKLKSFLLSEEGQLLLNECKKSGIKVEYELHVLQDLLPRSIFSQHPEYFRMNKNGERQKQFNMCFTSEAAYEEIEKNIINITNWMKPTSDRYFFWTDDVSSAFCYCEGCKPYSESEQALLYENKVLSILKKINPEAQLAHLAYQNTLKAPKKVIPLKGIFLEYAPIQRDYHLGLSEQHLINLKENLLVFPRESAHILEYWLDVSMFSNWDRNNLVKLPWVRKYVERDIEDYKDLGVKSITSFAAWINKDYHEQYGVDHVTKVLNEYGEVLNESRSITIDANLADWNDEYSVNGLTDPWDLKDRDHTLFNYKVSNGYFNFYFNVKDSTITMFPYIKELSVAEGDRVELFFSPQKEIHNYYCVEINPEGNVLDYSASYYREFNEEWNLKTLECSTNITADGYIVEGKIGLTELESLGIGNEFYLGIFRADYHGGEKVNWYTKTIPDSKTPDFHIPSAFEKVKLKN